MATILSLMHGTHLWVVALIMMVVAEVYAVGLMLMSRYRYGADRLKLNNEVAGFKFAVVGVFYAVMLAFVVIAVWENYSETENAVREEAKAAVDLYHVAEAIPNQGDDIQAGVMRYVKDVQTHAWDSMAVGERNEVVARDLRALNSAVLKLQPEDDKELVLFQHALTLVTLIADSRNERLDSANGSVPGVLWFVLIVGGLITLGYPAFFAASNAGAQVLMTVALAALVALSLLLALAFDFPFTGNPHITKEPFAEVLLQME
ncbi:MAG: bestrophin-like domain [Alphaproteobacteria bacterium]